MKTLTPEVLASMVGGQMEIQNSSHGFLFRGEISDLVIRGGVLYAKFSWLARAQGYPGPIKSWIKEDQQTYAASLDIFTVSNIGPSGGGVGGGDRWCLTSVIAGETVTIFPPNGSKLDPAKVVGLINVTA